MHGDDSLVSASGQEKIGTMKHAVTTHRRHSQVAHPARQFESGAVRSFGQSATGF